MGVLSRMGKKKTPLKGVIFEHLRSLKNVQTPLGGADLGEGKSGILEGYFILSPFIRKSRTNEVKVTGSNFPIFCRR